MSIGSISAAISPSAGPKAQPTQPAGQQTGAAKAHHHHHSGGDKSAAGLTSGTLTSSGNTPILDTLV